jgi:hypothetical protein
MPSAAGVDSCKLARAGARSASPRFVAALTGTSIPAAANPAAPAAPARTIERRFTRRLSNCSFIGIVSHSFRRSRWLMLLLLCSYHRPVVATLALVRGQLSRSPTRPAATPFGPWRSVELACTHVWQGQPRESPVCSRAALHPDQGYDAPTARCRAAISSSTPRGHSRRCGSRTETAREPIPSMVISTWSLSWSAPRPW